MFAARIAFRLKKPGRELVRRGERRARLTLALVMLFSVVVPANVNSAAASDLEWLSVSPLPAVRLNVAISGASAIPLQVAGGTEPYTITVTAGSLPSGMSVSGMSITGTPTSTGTSTFTLTATDANSAAVDRVFELSVVRGKRSVSLESVANSPAARVVLGDLASRTQAKNTGGSSSVIPNPLTSGWVTIEGSAAPYTMRGVDARTGQPYSFQTDVNYTADRVQWRKEGHEAASFTGGFTHTALTFSGRSARELFSTNGTCPNTNTTFNSYCSVFGPEVWTVPFVADQGESLSFAWAAQGGGDDYESYAFLVNTVNNEHTLLAYGRGGTQPWTTASGEIPANGTYQFRFVNGSYDRTGGFVLGAKMYVDTQITLGSTQTITFPEIGPQTTAPSAPNVLNLAGVVTASSGLTVTLTQTGTACTVNGLSVTLTGAGTCTLTANQSGSDLFVPAASITRSFTITERQAQAIVTASLTSSTAQYGETVTVTGGGGSGTGAFSYSLSTSTACSIFGTVITITQGTGDCAVVVTRAGDATYAQRSSAPTVITVSPRAVTVTGVTAVNRPFSAGVTTVTLQGATINGVIQGDSVGLAGASQGVAASDQPGTHAVTTSMSLTGPSASNYTLTQPSGITVTILKVQQALTLTAAQASAQYGDTVALNLTGGSGTGASSIALAPSTACTLSGTTVTITAGAGTCELAASKAGDAEYGPATSTPVQISVAPRPLTVTGTTAVTRAVNGTTAVVLQGATLNGVLAGDDVELAAATSGIASSDEAGVWPVTTSMTLAGADAVNYAVVQPQGITVRILALQQNPVTVALSQPGGLYGDTISLTPSGGEGTGAYSLTLTQSAACQLDGTTLTITSATGGCEFTVTRAADDDFDARTSSPITVPVGPRVLTVTGQTALQRPYDGTTAVEMPACNTFTLVGVLSADLVDLACPTSGTVTSPQVGARPVTTAAAFTVTGADASNYTVTQPSFTLSIGKAEAQIWFSGGLIQYLGVNGVGLPSASASPVNAGMLLVDWHDGTVPTTPGRYRVNLTLESQTHEATPTATFVTVMAGQTLPNNMPPPAIGPMMLRDDVGEPVTPVKPPSSLTVKQNDQPVQATLTRPTPTRLRIDESGAQTAFELAARGTPTGDERLLAAETDLVLLAGGVLDISGSGYQPAGTVEVWMFSEPQLLGTVTVEPDGTFQSTLDVPQSVVAGEHVIQLNGLTQTGSLGSTSVGVLVELPPSNDDPLPLRNPDGTWLVAPARGSAAIVGTTRVTVTTTLGTRTLSRDASDTLTVSASSGSHPFVLTLTPSRANSALRADALALTGNSTVDGTLTGYAPHSSVHVWMLPEQRLLGRVVTDKDGVVRFRISVPDDLIFGRHSLQLSGTSQTGLPAGVAVGVWHTASMTPFTDVEITDLFGPEIATLAAFGASQGFGDGRFRAQSTVTRGHATVMLGRLFDIAPSDLAGMFSDVPADDQASVIASLAHIGVVTGFPDGSFRPDEQMTRGQAALLVTRLMQIEAEEAPAAPFRDIRGRHDASAISVLHARGIVTGYEDGRFHPDATITRGQFARIIVHAQAQHVTAAR